MSNGKIIQNISDIKPVNSRGSFDIQNDVNGNSIYAHKEFNSRNSSAVDSGNTDSDDANKNSKNKVNFEDSFLAQVERSSRDIRVSSPPQNTIVNELRDENRHLVNENLKREKGFTEVQSLQRKEIMKVGKTVEKPQVRELSSSINIRAIDYGTQADFDKPLKVNSNGVRVVNGNSDNKIAESVYFDETVMDKKIGNFLNTQEDPTDKDFTKNRDKRKKYGESKRGKKLLPAILGKKSLVITPFSVSAATISFVVMITGFVALGLQAKDDIEVKGARAVNYIKEAKIDLQNKNFEMATTNLVSAKEEFSSAQDQLDKLGGDSLDVFAHIPFLSKISSGKNVVTLGNELSDAVLQLSKISKLLAGLENPLDLQNENRSSLTEIFMEAQKNINLARESLQRAEMSSAKIKIDDLPKKYQEKIKFIKDFLPLVNGSLDEFDRTSNIFLELFGQNGPRKYLIVFQNNQEMRATGGFIGSYGLLETNQGKIDRLKIEGIYNPDGQLKVNVVPPRPIQKISASWSTHDANWWPDFPKSAEKISWFYEKTGGPTVDGVIAVTPVLLQKMLEVTGPIEMPAYHKAITSKNFIKEIQQEVEVDYKRNNNDNKNYDKEEHKVSGEQESDNDVLMTVKKNKDEDEDGINDPKKILADLTPILFAKFFDLKEPNQAGKVIEILLEALKEKHILINFQNSTVQQIVSEQGWSGEILKAKKDYLMVINSNINGYKTDGVIDENINHQAEIKEDGSVVNTVTITRKHNGGNTKYDWWNKVNADYMRVYVPKGSKLISAEGYTREIDEEKLDYAKLGFQRDSDIEKEEKYMDIDEKSGTRIYDEKGKTVFANWVYVSPQERVTVVYKYLLPFKVDVTDGENNRYSLLIQKQSGSVNSNMQTEIEFPFAWRTTWVEPKNLQIDRQQGKLIFKHKLDTDQFIGAVFEEKN